MEQTPKFDASFMLIADKDFWMSDQANAVFPLPRHNW